MFTQDQVKDLIDEKHKRDKVKVGDIVVIGNNARNEVYEVMDINVDSVGVQRIKPGPSTDDDPGWSIVSLHDLQLYVAFAFRRARIRRIRREKGIPL